MHESAEELQILLSIPAYPQLTLALKHASHDLRSTDTPLNFGACQIHPTPLLFTMH